MATKKKKQVKPYSKIKLLNIPEYDGGAYIATKVHRSSFEIHITDCENKVQLHGGLRNMEQRKNALFKIDTAIQELIDLRNHLTDEFKSNGMRVKN